ncbi:MAG: HipA domain-containing protein [Burkholderiales bacterium]|nr:HipA domain-containing protein [Burkholderiales bacterium]
MNISKKLQVKVLGKVVGTLAQSSDRPAHVFSYLPDAPQTHFVSLLMPVRAESYVWKEGLHPFFQMNLPEGAPKDILRQRLGPSMPVDDFHLLELTGTSGIGRVEVSAWGGDTARTNLKINIEGVLAHTDSRAALLETLDELDVHQMGISGVMPKASLAPNAKLTVKTGSAILKTGREDTPGIAINEFLCMGLAAQMGLPVPDVELSDDGNVLAVRRFDRDSIDGTPLGLEDFCALLALSPTDKYRPSMESVAAQLRRFCAESNIVSSSKSLISMLVLNLVVRNADAHAKNYALLYTSAQDAILAPVYDVVTVHAYQKFANSTFGLSIGGNKGWNLRKQLDRFCLERLNLPLSTVSDAVELAAAGMQKLLPEIERYANGFPQFRDTGKRMVKLWQAGLQATAGNQVTSVLVDFSAAKLSDEQRRTKIRKVMYTMNRTKIM